MRSSGEMPAAATTASFNAFNNPRRFSLGRPEMNIISRTIRSSEYLRPRNDRNNSGANKRAPSEVEKFYLPPV
jgi:hypothetical protein